MRINAFCTARPMLALDSCDRVIYCGDGSFDDRRIEIYRTAGIVRHPSDAGIYIPTMLDEDALTHACDIIISDGVKAVVRAAYDLDEAGLIEAKYKLSPVMLLHKLGVLGYCTIAGGVCLDNDDLDLMAQEGAKLVLTPTASCGYGHGIAPVCAAIKRLIVTGVGTFDGKYNNAADLDMEINFLQLTANSEMRCENAISSDRLKKLIAFE